MSDIPTPVATTIESLGIAFALRNKLEDERNENTKQMLKDLSIKIDEDIKTKADKEYVEEMRKDLDTLANNAVTKSEFRIGIGVITITLSIVTAVIGLWKSLTGK